MICSGSVRYNRFKKGQTMNKESVIKKLQENIKIIYHRAVDADKQLEQLRQQKKAGFAQIFTNDSAFKNHSTTFLPYVEELAADLQAIQTDNSEHYKTLIPAIVVKIELLFKTLKAFKDNLKGE
ncbi:MAG: primosomal protein N'' [Psychromonas sp.]